MNRLIQWLSILFFLVSNNSSAQIISGAITSNTTWSGNITADSVFIPVGITLTIQPGTTVKFNTGKMLVVAGKIIADGKSDSLIFFTSNSVIPAPGDWNGIELQATALVTSVINFCVVEYGGGGSNTGNIFYKTGAPAISITNSVIQYSSSHGINLRASQSRIANTVLRQNAGYAVFADLSSSFIVDSSTISNNTIGGILVGVNSTASILNSAVDSNGTGIFISSNAAPTIKKNYLRRNNIGIQYTGGVTQPTITQDTIVNNITWGFLNTSTSTTVLARRNYWGNDAGPFNPSSNPTGLGDKVSNFVDFQPWTILAPTSPYISVTGNIAKDSTWSSGVFWIKNDIAVNTGFKLTIKPGVIVKLAIGVRLTVNGSINASGTADSLIVFTSIKDDSYGGHNDTTTAPSIPARGDWDMVWLYINQNSTSILNNCIFKWGGSTGNGNVRVDGASPTIDNIYSTQSSNYGLYLINGANVTVSNSTFGSNSLDGLLIQSSNPSIYKSTTANNGRYGIYANGNSRFTIRKSKLTGNTYGIIADGGTASATLISLDSSIVSFNTIAGLYLWYGTGPQTFAYNRIEGNGAGYGLWCFNVNALVTIDSNIIINHGGEGIVTSRASITNNLIQGNSLPITLIGRVNSTYSGNTIVGNKYNYALGLRANRGEEGLRDTLSTVFPAGITSKTYFFIDDASSVVVASGTTLVIQPGVIIKIAAGLYFRVDGTLIANGTPSDPIVFTSYRDASYGGKTNLLTDNTAPAPGDWQYVRLYTNTTSGTVFNNCVFKYGGLNGYGNLFLSNDIVFTNPNPITNIISRKSSSNGIYLSDCKVTFDNVTLDSNAAYGLYVLGNRPSDVTVRNSFIQDNNGAGMQAVNNSAFREVSNCFIRRNNGWGIGTSNGTLAQYYFGNTVTNNAAGGIYTNSPPILPAEILFVGNTVTDNGTEGILSSRATFIDNIIQRNRFPLAVWRRTGNIYTDNSGADGNVISNNTYNAIAIWDAEISDTLKATFPKDINSKTYVALYDFQVATGTTLVIEPGVIVKFQQIPANNWHRFDVYGTLMANGTQANPIIFTSWRDSTVGGKTTSLTDYAPPAPGDWYYIAFRNGSGASVVRNCQFKYGGRDGQKTVYFETNIGGLTFSNNVVRRSMSAGIYVYNTPIIIDSTVVDSCAETGIQVGASAANIVSIRNSKIFKNGVYGVWVQNPANLSVLSNCYISNNTKTGFYIENNTISLSVIGNTINNNGDHGMYLLARNDAIDTLLMIAGNKVLNNGLTGIFSSRAYIIDDSISGNRYAIGVIGQLSLAGTGTSLGNFYENNVIAGNKYNDVLLTQEDIFGELGAVLPPNYSKVIAVRGDLNVASGTTLRIAPGSIIKFPKEYGSGYILVNGTLLSEGTTTDKIVFTSWKDDTYGGDTNLDTSSAIPIPGDWNRIQLSGATTNASHFLNTIIRYGDGSNTGSLYFNQTSAMIESCFVSYAKSWGMQLNSSSSQVIGTEIHHNGSGIYVSGTPLPIVNNNNIYLNTTYGFYSSSTGATTNAKNNYWGHVTGPLKNQGINQNLTGLGNKIFLSGTGEVDYQPYLTTRSGILPGDVSGNGQISAFDGSMILQYIVSQISLTPVQRLAANVSGDTTVSAFDASYILRYVVGLISGFPGLGKLSIESDIASAFAFNIEKGHNPNEFDLVIHLNKPTNVFGLNFKLSFDTTLVKPIGMKKTMESDSMMMFHNFPSGYANLAMAGIKPLNATGNVARFTFTLLDPAKAQQQVLFAVKKFVLNEMDVTSDVGSIILNVDDITEVPTTFALSQNYPNPFNPITSIKYQIPISGNVRMSIYNLLGQEIKTLVNEQQSAGFYTIRWNGTDNTNRSVSSGVYIYKIDARAEGKEKFTQVKKMILVK
ncbi:MAG: right-handed parallel beta-helix repeat-containing protein [Bacteroidota bacterium]|nr:right-handed parallel beta-helix repeat-containing protein [Bacteroidota bacterium]